MRLSEIGDKEIIDIKTGNRHGQLWDAEIIFDENTGTIQSLLVPDFEGVSRFSKKSGEMLRMPWSNILKIGGDVIIFESVL